MTDFTTIAPRYKQTSSLQKSASEHLFDLLEISATDNVLDLGCGTGHITQAIRSKTKGIVVGIDPSDGMITEAKRNSSQGIAFQVGSAESLNVTEQFTAIFCNSAFQWFRDPLRGLSNCFNALRSGGRMAIQAPARKNYCPNFVAATDSLMGDPIAQEIFAQFRSPWVFLETADAYAKLFRQVGFLVSSAEIEEVVQPCSPAKVLEMFESGAAAGYFNPDCYAIELPSGFVANARKRIAESFRAQADENNQVQLKFFRIYLLASRP